MADPASTVLFRRIRRRLNRARVRALARRMSLEIAEGRPFTCLISGDAELQRLNREFRGRDYATDVLSFPTSGAGLQARGRPPGRPRSDTTAPLGDIAISAGRAAAQARLQGRPVEDEIGILMLHGLLHLLGYDHQRDRGRMERAEARWRRTLGLPAGLTERGRP